MKAVVYKGLKKVAVEEVPDPKIEKPSDAIIKITSSAICGSDLHMYDGHTEAKPGLVLGHEPMGIVDKIGEDVSLIKEGDRVVVPFNVACGFCFNCIRGFTNACLTLNPQAPGAAYGYVSMGPYWGSQAEYLRAPQADWACEKLPGKPFDDMEDDFVLLADIFPTAYHSTELAGVKTGMSVAIFGAGPVGLLAAYSAKLKGASEIYIVDNSQRRLDLAKNFGAVPVNYENGDPVQQIMQMRKENQMLMQTMQPGDEKLLGVMCGIDAVGYQAEDRNNPNAMKPTQVLNDLIRIVNATGMLGIIGVYLKADPMAANEQEKQGMMTLRFGELWMKGLTVGTGQAPVKNYQRLLRDLIIAQKAKPSLIVSDHITIDEAPETYAKFDERDKVVKAVIQFK